MDECGSGSSSGSGGRNRAAGWSMGQRASGEEQGQRQGQCRDVLLRINVELIRCELSYFFIMADLNIMFLRL